MRTEQLENTPADMLRPAFSRLCPQSERLRHDDMHRFLAGKQASRMANTAESKSHRKPMHCMRGEPHRMRSFMQLCRRLGHHRCLRQRTSESGRYRKSRNLRDGPTRSASIQTEIPSSERCRRLHAEILTMFQQ